MSANDKLVREVMDRLDAQEKRHAELLAELRRARGEEETPPLSGNDVMNNAIRVATGRFAPVEPGEGDK